MNSRAGKIKTRKFFKSPVKEIWKKQLRKTRVDPAIERIKPHFLEKRYKNEATATAIISMRIP
jgi:hypothetical protein